MNLGKVMILFAGFALLALGANGIGLALFSPHAIAERRKFSFAAGVMVSVLGIALIFWMIPDAVL